MGVCAEVITGKRRNGVSPRIITFQALLKHTYIGNQTQKTINIKKTGKSVFCFFFNSRVFRTRSFLSFFPPFLLLHPPV